MFIEVIERMLSEEMLGIVLKDDDNSYGGVSFPGETLKDFLNDVDINPDSISLKEVDQILKECGIKPVGDVFIAIDLKKRIKDLAFLKQNTSYYSSAGELAAWTAEMLIDGMERNPEKEFEAVSESLKKILKMEH